jgi:Family of unknown function (DUF6459)
VSVPSLPLPVSDLPELRLLPAPACEPPYDDEQAPLPVLRLLPAAPPPLRLVPGTPRADRATTAPRPDLPQPRRFAHALVQRLLEVQAGVRPLSQLQRDTTPGLFADLERALVRRPRPASRPSRRTVHSVHVQERAGGLDGAPVAEVCATVTRGERRAAVALRLEVEAGRWVCSQLTGV